MESEKKLSSILKNPPDARHDAVLCVFLLAACLAYDSYSSVTYLTSFNHGIFDFAWRPIGRDFINYWTAGVAVFDDFVVNIFEADPFHAYQEKLLGHPFAEHNWSYPPHILLLLWPFGLLPYLWALAAWSFVTLGIYLWASVRGRQDRHILVLALLLAPATFSNFAGGQNGFLTGALLICGLRLLGPQPIIAGILFGVLTVKPQLGLLLPFALLAARQWTAIFSACVTAALMIGLSVALFGWESWVAYIEQVIPHQATIMNQRDGIFLAMMPSAYMGLRLLEAEPLLRIAIHGSFAVTALAGVIWAFARSADAELKFGVLAVGTFLASPYGFNYDMTTVSLAVALVALRGLRDGFLPGERLVLSATWLLPTAILWLNANHIPVGSLILLACFAYFVIRIRDSLTHENKRGFTWAKAGEALQS
jgi:hypothetical protein